MGSRAISYYPRALHGDGGVTKALWLWAESLRTAGMEVEVRFDERLGDRNTGARLRGVSTRPVAHVGTGRLSLPVSLLDPSRDAGSVLVLHSGYVAFNLRAAQYAYARGIPYVITPHGAYDPHVRASRPAVRRCWEVAERRMLHRALAVHVFFPAEVPHVRDLAPQATVVTSPTAHGLPERAWMRPGHSPYVAWIGRYDVRHKGLDRLLDAMQALPLWARPDLRLHGRDSKDTRGTVQTMVDNRGLQSHVTVGPPVDGAEKQNLLLGAAAYVHPSRWESYGVALVEALAYGVPCITTTDSNLAGPLLRDRAAVVAQGSAAGISRALRAVGSDQVSALGAQGREFVFKRLSHETAGRELVHQISAVGAAASQP